MLEFRSMWFLRVSSVALLLLRDVTGKLSLAIGGLCSVSRWYYFNVVLDAFGWSLQPMVRREIRVQLPDRQQASKLKLEDERE